MGSNGVLPIKIPRNGAAECSQTTVEIKIKTLDSQTYTLRVDKCVIISLPTLYYSQLLSAYCYGSYEFHLISFLLIISLFFS